MAAIAIETESGHTDASSSWNSCQTRGTETMTTSRMPHADALELGLVVNWSVLTSAFFICGSRYGIHTNQQAEAVRPKPYIFPYTYPPESIAVLATAELRAYKADAPNKWR